MQYCNTQPNIEVGSNALVTMEPVVATVMTSLTSGGVVNV